MTELVLVPPASLHGRFATPALAADILPQTASQKTNLGVVTVQTAATGTSPALAYPARVTLPPRTRIRKRTGHGLSAETAAAAGALMRRASSCIAAICSGLSCHTRLSRALAAASTPCAAARLNHR